MSQTASNVAEMESELFQLRAENEMLRRNLAVKTADADRLTIENALAMNASRNAYARSVRMETIMKQVSSGLVAGLREMQQESEIARAIARGDLPDRPPIERPPLLNKDMMQHEGQDFDRRPSLQTHAVNPTTGATEMERRELRAADQFVVQSQQSISERAEKIFRSNPPRSVIGSTSPRIDESLASRDPRLPPASMGGDPDNEQLQELGGRMTTR